MHPDLGDIHEHMKHLGLGLLSQAQKNAFFYHYQHALDEGIFAVLQAAHAAEILIKACIAEKNPLLIFSNAAKFLDSTGEIADIDRFFDEARTIEYSKLPGVLKATTGYEIDDLARYKDFGKTRNMLQHFAEPDVDLRIEAGKYIYGIIAPLIHHFWGLYAIEYCDDPEKEQYLPPILLRQNLAFQHPPHWQPFIDAAIKDVQDS